MMRGRSTGGGTQEFDLKSPQEVFEFAKGNPESIKSLAASSQTMASIAAINPQLAKRGQVIESYGAAYVEARVRLDTYDEAFVLDYLKEHGPALVLGLCHVHDPRNLGAIVRSAAFYGVPFVVVPKNRQVLLTEASVATSQGGFAHTRLGVVTNMARFIESTKSLNYWAIGLDAHEASKPVNFTSSDRLLLLCGNEAKGLSANMLKKCDAIMRLGPENTLQESLNVSVACAVALDRIICPRSN